MGDVIYLNSCVVHYCKRQKTLCQLCNGVCELSFWDQNAVKEICQGCQYYYPGSEGKKRYNAAKQP